MNKKFPFLFFTFFLLIGIWFGQRYNYVSFWVFSTLLLSLTVFILNYFYKNRFTIFYLHWFLIFSIAGSISSFKWNYAQNQITTYSNLPKCTAIATVIESSTKGTFSKIIVKVDSIYGIGKTDFNCTVFTKDSISLYEYNDKVQITGYLNPNKKETIEELPDFQEINIYKGITHTCFADKISKLRSQENYFDIKYTASALRTYWKNLLINNLKDEQIAGLAGALVLGINFKPDDEIKNIYSTTGTIHLLAVSGMHVSMLCALLIGIFTVFKSSSIHSLKPKQGIIIIFLLILYALMTGLSPSVLRAVVMYSMLILAHLLNRRSAILNNIAVSAFILLLYDPFMMYHIGFQLSYLALLGIIYIKPLIDKLIPETTTNVLLFLRDLITLCLAAQIAVLPLTIYYFHQASLSFLPANFIANPLSMLILYFGLLLLLIHWIVPIGKIISLILLFLIELQNAFIRKIALLKYSLLTGISISWETMVIFTSLLFLIAFIFSSKKYKLLFLVPIGGIILCFTFFIHTYKLTNRKLISFKKISNGVIIDYVQGKMGTSTVFLFNKSNSKLNKVHLFRTNMNYTCYKTDTFYIQTKDTLQINHPAFKEKIIAYKVKDRLVRLNNL